MTQTRQTRIVSELRKPPFIRLRGRWLENAGFEIGDDVRIEVRDHQLIITKVTSATATPQSQPVRCTDTPEWVETSQSAEPVTRSRHWAGERIRAVFCGAKP